MRDEGFDFEWYDKYCTNIFAKYHEKSKKHYDVVTAFELMEHFVNPLKEIELLMDLGDNVIASTLLLPNPAPDVGSWWYYALDEGQHIAFYTKKCMEIIAEKHNRYYCGFHGFHIFSRRKVPTWKLRMAIRLPGVINYCIRRKSLLPEDYTKISGCRLS